MNEDRDTSVPPAVLSAFLGILPIGIVLGVLYGIGAINGLALDFVFFGGLAVFVPWAVLKLDSKRLSKVADESPMD